MHRHACTEKGKSYLHKQRKQISILPLSLSCTDLHTHTHTHIVEGVIIRYWSCWLCDSGSEGGASNKNSALWLRCWFFHHWYLKVFLPYCASCLNLLIGNQQFTRCQTWPCCAMNFTLLYRQSHNNHLCWHNYVEKITKQSIVSAERLPPISLSSHVKVESLLGGSCQKLKVHIHKKLLLIPAKFTVLHLIMLVNSFPGCENASDMKDMHLYPFTCLLAKTTDCRCRMH